MRPLDYVFRRPQVVVAAVVSAALAAIVIQAQIPRLENPPLPDRAVAIRTGLPGADPETIEHLVTQPLEESLQAVEDIERIVTSSDFGTSLLLVEVSQGAPAAARIQEVREAVLEASSALPAGIQGPVFDERLFRTNTMLLGLHGEGLGRAELAQHAETLKRLIEAHPDTRSVEVFGRPEDEVRVSLDLLAMAARSTSFGHVFESLADQNVRLPSGELELGGNRVGIRTDGRYRNLDSIRGAPIFTPANREPFVLGDIATVEIRPAEEFAVRVSGKVGVVLGVEVLAHRNVIRFGDELRLLLADVSSDLGTEIELQILADGG